VANVGYVPGALTAVAGESCLALVETAPDSPAAAWIWQQAGQGASAQALLAGLLGAGFEGVGGFTLLDQPAAGPRRLFCRGAVAATVVGGTAVGGTAVGGTVVGGTATEGTGAAVTASARIDGVGLLTWREHVVAADAERIYLGQPPGDGALWLPAAAGVLLAGCVIVDLAQTAPPAAPPPGVRAVGHPEAGSSGGGGSSARSPAGGSPGAGSPVWGSPGARGSGAGSPVGGSPGAGGSSVGSPVAGSPGAGGSGVGSLGVVDSGGDGSAAEFAVEDSPDAVPAAEAPAQPDVTEIADPVGGPDRASEPAIRQDAVAGISGLPAPDGWFKPSGASRGPDAASSASRPDAPSAIARPWEPPSGSSNGEWAAPPLDNGPDPSAAPPEPEGPGGLIDEVPWGAGPGAPAAPSADRMPAPVVPPPPALGPDEDGLTVKRVDPVAGPESPTDPIGPDVPALICPAGHVNSPREVTCRLCGAALPPDPVIVARPVLGVLRLSTGDVVTLDRDVVLGRHPPDDFTGANGEGRPHMVRLPSPDGVISRTHLRVTLSGWQVLVTDLNSTNGTRVTLPGSDPEQLPPGIPVPIRAGTVVTLAEGVDFRFEDAAVS
jgi:FHA domain